MRELKFRVWDDYINDWHATGATTEFTDKCNKGYNFNIVCFRNPERVHIEQYTGLKDKNGKEIYEGDIVTLDDEGEEIDCSLVFFKEGCFRVGDGVENEAGSYLSNWRIIGNTHENFDLLEGGR